VARFVGVRNIFQGEVRRQESDHQILALDSLEIAVLTELEGNAHASLRAEDIALSREPLRSSAHNILKGTITGIVDRGTLIYVTVDVPPSFICAITRTSLEEMALEEGAEAHIAFNDSAVHIF
jgi:molybdopterin-binding protein